MADNPAESVPGQASRLPVQGLLFLAALTLIWGASWPIMKIAAEGLPVFTFRAISALGCGSCVMAIAYLSGRSLRLPRRIWRPMLLIALMNATGWLYLSALALTLMPSGHAAMIAYTMPLWAFIIGIPVMGDRPKLSHWLGLAMGISAVGVLTARGWTEIGEAPWGAIAMLGSAVLWAGGTVTVKKVDWGIPMIVVVGWQFTLGGIPLLAAALGDIGILHWPTTEVVWATIFSTFVALGLGYWLWFRIVELVPVSVSSISVLAVPAVGLASSALILSEPIGPTELVALALVIGALITVVPKPKFGGQA